MVAAIAYRGETLLSIGYGTTKKGSKTVPDGDTIFRIGSITKVFVVSGNSSCIDAFMCGIHILHNYYVIEPAKTGLQFYDFADA